VFSSICSFSCDNKPDSASKSSDLLHQEDSEAKPSTSREYNQLGVSHYNKNEYAKALEHFEKALELDLLTFDSTPAFRQIIHQNLGLVFLETEEYDKAIWQYNKALSLNLKHGESSAQAESDLALIYNNLGLSYDAITMRLLNTWISQGLFIQKS
jgi:tetratricopeptide (TPR) repeat protein